MNLLLDARKKLQQTQMPQPGDPASAAPETEQQNRLENGAGQTMPPETRARDTGHNLFAAKTLLSTVEGTLPSRNLLLALVGTVLLFMAGMFYLWFAGSANNTVPLHRASAPPAPPVQHIQPAAADERLVRNMPATSAGQLEPAVKPEKIHPLAAPAENAPIARPQLRKYAVAQQNNSPVRIEQKKTGQVDPILMDAYLAYRGGQLDKAWRLYQAMFTKDARNTDVLLGLAAIAQQRGENQAAAQYFGMALALDPRNATANAGMAGLSPDDDYDESRLKILLREQGNSAILHFALGNLYAGQSRWGEAQQAYFNAYLQSPSNTEFAFNLAVSLDHLGQKKLAAQYYQRAMQLDPSQSAGFDHAQILQRTQELVR